MSSSPSPAFDGARFRRACARFATGVAIAAVVDEAGAPHGLTVNSFTSVSLDPPLVLISIDAKAAILHRFVRSNHYGISVLREDQTELSNRFAGPRDDRFDGVPWRAGASGVPLIEDALASFECLVERHIEAGDHTLFVGRVIAAEAGEGRPLLFFGSAYRRIAE